MDLNGYAGSGIVGMAGSCNVTRTGAIGSIGDGCYDAAERTVNVAMAVAVAVLAWHCLKNVSLSYRQTATALAIATVMLSSMYHVLFGENHTGTAPNTATKVLDTRNATVPVTIGALALVIGICDAPRISVAGGIAALAVGIALVTNFRHGNDDAAAAMADGAGVVAGIVAAAWVSTDQEESHRVTLLVGAELSDRPL
jgi:hypothetical protein